MKIHRQSAFLTMVVLAAAALADPPPIPEPSTNGGFASALMETFDPDDALLIMSYPTSLWPVVASARANADPIPFPPPPEISGIVYVTNPPPRRMVFEIVPQYRRSTNEQWQCTDMSLFAVLEGPGSRFYQLVVEEEKDGLVSIGSRWRESMTDTNWNYGHIALIVAGLSTNLEYKTSFGIECLGGFRGDR